MVSIEFPFFGRNQFEIKDPKRQPPKGTTMETISKALEPYAPIP